MNCPSWTSRTVQVSQGANRMRVPLLSRGGVDARSDKKSRSVLIPRRRGGAGQGSGFPGQHHPVRSYQRKLSRFFLGVAATPPRLRRGTLRTTPSRIQLARKAQPVRVSPTHQQPNLEVCLARRGERANPSWQFVNELLTQHTRSGSSAGPVASLAIRRI